MRTLLIQYALPPLSLQDKQHAQSTAQQSARPEATLGRRGTLFMHEMPSCCSCRAAAPLCRPHSPGLALLLTW